MPLFKKRAKAVSSPKVLDNLTYLPFCKEALLRDQKYVTAYDFAVAQKQYGCWKDPPGLARLHGIESYSVPLEKEVAARLLRYKGEFEIQLNDSLSLTDKCFLIYFMLGFYLIFNPDQDGEVEYLTGLMYKPKKSPEMDDYTQCEYFAFILMQREFH